MSGAEQRTLLIIKAAIHDMTEADRKSVDNYAKLFREIIRLDPENARIGLALVVAELAAEEDPS